MKAVKGYRRHLPDRFYCTKCGCVWGGWFSPVNQGWVVMPHHRYVPGEFSYSFVPCEGGLVDQEVDRAP